MTAQAAARWYMGGGDILLFISLSLLSSLFIGQDQIVSRGDVFYWVLVGPALLLPALRFRQTIQSLFLGLARPFAIFGFFGCTWFLVRGDYAVIPPLVLLVWVAGWVLRSEASISLNKLLVVLLVFYLAGVVRYYSQPSVDEIAWFNNEFVGEPEGVTDNQIDALDGNPDSNQSAQNTFTVQPDQTREGLELNGWGVLPGQTASTYGPWRISVTPNIATSGTVSLFVIMLALAPMAARPLQAVAFLTGGYFLRLSFVRSAFLGLSLFCLAQISLRLLPDKPVFRGALAMLLVSGAIIVTASAPSILYLLQDIDVVSRLLLRGQTDLSINEIYRQVYRPWLWGQHLSLFLTSDYWMGLGSDVAISSAETSLSAGHARSDSVSLPTRLLAIYGLPAIAFFWFIVERCCRHIKENDIWAISAASAIIWLMMTWGSVFHPTNALFLLSILILGKGSTAFSSVIEDRR